MRALARKAYSVYAVAVVLLALAQTAGAERAAEPLVGVVVDHRGQALAAVDVWLSSGLPTSHDRPVIGGALWFSDRPQVRELQAVLAHVQTDREGRFRIDLPPQVIQSQEPLPLALWAHQPGGYVAARRLSWAIPAPAESIKLVVQKDAGSTFRVLGPDEAPEPNARVLPVETEGLIIPDALAEKFASTTGGDGSVVLPAFPPGAIRRLRVDSRRFGKQLVRVRTAETTSATVLALVPVGRVSVHILAEAGKPVSGLHVEAQTFPDGYDLGRPIGQADSVTDANGQVEIPAIAAGRLALLLDLRSRPELPYRGLPPENQVALAGQAVTVEIHLKKAVRMEGVVRERKTSVPIPFVSPEIPDLAIRLGGNPKVLTDANGRFEGYIEGQEPYAFLYTTPKPYFIPSDRPEKYQLLPAGATEFKLPPIELVRGASLRGTVVDETGKSVAGALVRASWGGKDNILQSVAVRTDSVGGFLLDGLDPVADLRLTALSDGEYSGPAQIARASPDKAVKLVVSPSHTVMLRGRVLDSAGKPVHGARVRIRSQTRHTEGQVWRVDPVSFGERTALETDKDGRFQTPFGVPVGLEYEAMVTAPQSPPGRTAWLKTLSNPTADFSEVVLDRIRSVEGLVEDRTGSPLAGVTIFQSGDGPIRTQTVTAADGKFRLSGLIAGKVILFARKDGFQFHGQPVDTEAGSPTLVLTRVDEKARALKTLDPVIAHQEELALARRLFAPYLEKAMAGGSDRERYQTLRVLAQVDPGRALELIESNAAGKPRAAVDSLRSLVAGAFATQSPDEAVTIAESIQEPGSRSWCLIDLVDKLPASARERKIELLTQASLQARGIKNPGERIHLLGRLADRWLDLGEKDRAASTLAEGRALAKEVPAPAYEVLMFAPALARTDLGAALGLIENGKAVASRGDRVSRVFVFDRAYGEMAYRIASSDAAGAERVLGLIVDAHRRGGYVVAACMRMAAVDLPRALRLAETIDDPVIRAYALGQTARELAPVDKSAAARLLEDAFSRLEKHRDVRAGYSSAACIAAALLSAVEAIEPARLEASVWRAIALRPPSLAERGDRSGSRLSAELAMSIARYDRTAAAAIIARELGTFRKVDVDSYRQGTVAAALAIIDPARLISLVESLPDDPTLERTLPKNYARLNATEMLAKQGDERWKFARGTGVSLWTPERSDL